MQIGRKIYFLKATGNVILEIGECEYSVIETTINRDFNDFPSLIGKNIGDYDFLQLVYNERINEFNNLGSMHVNPTTKELIIYPKLTITTDKTSITSDGVDTVTITVTIQDTVNAHTINFNVNNGTPIAINTVNGVATLPITTTIVGDYNVVATSDIYGANSVVIRGV